jgi:ABC-type lipoprotein export system ATPase subunit
VLDASQAAFRTAASEADIMALAIERTSNQSHDTTPSQRMCADEVSGLDHGREKLQAVEADVGMPEECSLGSDDDAVESSQTVKTPELSLQAILGSRRDAECESKCGKLEGVALAAGDGQTEDLSSSSELAAPLLAEGVGLPPWPFGLVVVLGPSSSGKSNWLRHLHQHYAPHINAEAGQQKQIDLHDNENQNADGLFRAIASHPGLGTHRLNRLQSVGLNDVPAWTRPLHVLSNGQRARFMLATKLGSGMVVDDFAATIDSHTACSTAAAIARTVRKGHRGIIIGTTRQEVVPWLSPDFVIFAATGELFQRPPHLQTQAAEVSLEPLFGHFVNACEASKGERCGWQPLQDAPLDRGVVQVASRPWTAGDRACCWNTRKVDGKKVLKCRVQMDAHVIEAAGAFEYNFDGNCETHVPLLEKRMLPNKFVVGIIIGPSGTGKSSLLNTLGRNGCISWAHNTSVVDTIAATLAGMSAALDLLRAMALPGACLHRTRQQLSNGEGYRADAALALALAIASDAEESLTIDEWTSELDRQTARAVCHGLSSWMRNGRKGKLSVVLATVHEDTAGWLQPDWVFDTGTCTLSKRTAKHHNIKEPKRKCAEQTLSQGVAISAQLDVDKLFAVPKLRLEVHSLRHLSFEGLKAVWSSYFASHHYLKGSLQNSATCVLVREEGSGTPVAFHASLAQPGTIRDAWREHRFVVRPQWQGLSIGPRLSNLMAARFHVNAMRYYSTTAHPRLAASRSAEGSPWKPCNSSAADGKRSSVAGHGLGFNKSSSKTIVTDLRC